MDQGTGEDLSAVHIPGHVLSPYWTNAGRLESTPCAKIKTIYVTTRDPNGYYGLYAVSRDGEKERLLYKAKSISVTAGRVVYTDENEDLYTATIAGNQLGEKKRIARSAFCAFLSENGKYVYYLTNVSDSFGTLYGYRIGDKAPKKIAPDIHVEWPSSIKCISEDGSAMRLSRSLTHILRMSAASIGLTSRLKSRMSGNGSEESVCARTCGALGPSNGGRPAIISKRTTPSE